MRAWIPLLRMARRQVRRNRLRSLLIVLMIALPVATVVLADVTWRSNPLSRAQVADRLLGQADATVRYVGGVVQQDPMAMNWGSSGELGNPTGVTDDTVRRLVPSLTDLELDASTTIVVKAPDGVVSADAFGRDWTRPSMQPSARLLSGTFATSGTTIAISSRLAHDVQASVGSVLSLHSGQSFTVSGVYRDAFAPSARSANLTPAGFATLNVPASAPTWYVATSSPLLWADVDRLNQAGYLVVSRAVILDPPPRSQVRWYSSMGRAGSGATTRQLATGIAVGVVMALLQLALLAGPAFAVSARRRRYSLALIAAVGGDRAALRRTMLAESVVLGFVASVAGLGLGMAASLGLRALRTTPAGPLRLHWLELGGIVVFGLVSALVAALIPAHMAARLNVVAALAGRRAETSSTRRVSTLGLVLLAAGLVTGIVGIVGRHPYVIVAGIAAC